MTRLKWVGSLVLLAIATSTSWLWWTRPQKADMAIYAPANSLIFVEVNHPLTVVDTITHTDVWKIINETAGSHTFTHPKGWLQSIIAFTGVGPINSVILARAQIAVVITDLGTMEDGETLRVKPEGALLIETHTAERRIRAPVEEALKKLADITYGNPTSRRTTIDGVEFIEWVAPEGSREIVATIVGSLVIIGNSEQSVRNCLAVSLRRTRSLKGDPELERMRVQLAGDRALAFGYVPRENSTRLLSVGVPLMLGRPPGDSEFQRLITANAAKVLGGLGWSSHAFRNGIEDRYLIALQPSIVARLKSDFTRAQTNTQIKHPWPADVHSVTYYRFENPAIVWQNLKASASSQMDVVATIVFSSLLKSALLSYGIEEPENFLAAIKGEVLTLRVDPTGDRTMMIADVRDQSALREIIKRRIGLNAQTHFAGGTEILKDSQSGWAASLSKDLVVLGSSADVLRYSEGSENNGMMPKDDVVRKTAFSVSGDSANIVTYTNDADRVGNFVSAVFAAIGKRSVASESIDPMIAKLPYSATETTLGEYGFERVTKSPLGQFASILPLLFTQNTAPAKQP